MLACYGTNEDHLKGTLHFHLAIYGGIGPDVLQDYATVQEICDAISETLDSTHNTFIPDSIHVEHQMRDVMEEHRKPYEPSRCDRGHCFQGNIDWMSGAKDRCAAGFSTAILKSELGHQTATQMRHKHMMTCRKGFNGCTGCRLCQPKEILPYTALVELEIMPREIDPSNGKETEVGCLVHDVPAGSLLVAQERINRTNDRSCFYLDPLEQRDTELVVWEVARNVVRLNLKAIKNEGAVSSQLQNEGAVYSELQEKTSFLVRKKQLAEFARLAGQAEDRNVAKSFLDFVKEKDDAEIDEMYQQIYSKLPLASGYVVESNPILSMCSASHNACLLLGSLEQGNASLFYVANYIGKNKIALEQCLTVLDKAHQHIQEHPSKASQGPAGGTALRAAMHLLERTLNKVNLLMEVTDYQIAASLLELPTEVTSETFAFFDSNARAAFVDFDMARKHIENELDQEIIRFEAMLSSKEETEQDSSHDSFLDDDSDDHDDEIDVHYDDENDDEEEEDEDDDVYDDFYDDGDDGNTTDNSSSEHETGAGASRADCNGGSLHVGVRVAKLFHGKVFFGTITEKLQSINFMACCM